MERHPKNTETDSKKNLFDNKYLHNEDCKLKKNEIRTLKIEDITNLGFGVAKVDGAVVFVSDTVPGDEVTGKIIKVSSSYAVARVEEYITLSPMRECRCKNAACKSCAYKNIGYDQEKKLKWESVKSDFVKAGLPEVEILPLVGSPKESEYRNKAQYPISGDGKDGYKIGFYAPKSHRVTEASDCMLAPAVFSEIISELRTFFQKYSLTVYDEETGHGLLRHIYLRRGEVSGEILLTLVINGNTLPHHDELCDIISEKFPNIVGLLLNINKENTNVILGEKFITLFGRDYIIDTLAGVNLRISAPAFYQVNHAAAELLYAKAKDLLCPTKDDLLLDLYCGAGSIGLSMAKEVGELIGVEIVEPAVVCARQNALDNSIENARFFTGDAKNTERLLEIAECELERKISPTAIVLDPPRAGCAEELIKYVSSLNPQRIVYISCNPTTLARDMVIFKELGYVGKSVTPFDLFPLTGHVESLVCLRRQTN